MSANQEAVVEDLDAGDFTPSYYDSFTFEDRKGEKWIYRGPHAGGNPTLKMRFYYNTLEGFAFPNPVTGINVPRPVGSIEPYLRQPEGSGGYLNQPIDVVFNPIWPELVDPANPELDDPDIPNAPPSLLFADTLTKAKDGLPAVRGQSSARIIYEQSRAVDSTGQRQTAVLFDPTRAKTVLLTEGQLEIIPPDIATDSRSGRTYFQNLPPHLKERFYYDPNIGELGALVLLGDFVEPTVGAPYLLLNTLSASDLTAIQGLSGEADWDTAASNLETTIERFVESTDVPGTYVPEDGTEVVAGARDLPVITDSDQAVHSYALSAVGGGTGYVSLIFGDGEAFTPEGEPVTVAIIHVGGGLESGMIRPLLSANPLDEQVTVRHTGDFGAMTEDYEFQWRFQPPVNGKVAAISYDQDNPGAGWIAPNGAPFENQYVVKGTPPLLSLGDNYWTMRFRPLDTTHPVRIGGASGWSNWTEAALVEGWIKRALAGINPFNQRVTDFFNTGIDTNVSILTQAGRRWEGDIALNLANINEFGLIEIYETILNRGIGISINGTPATDYGPANDALLLAAGYLADLYTILGDEAFADASNPTIAFDAQAIGSVADSSIAVDFDSVFQETATARFAFQGQAANLLEEELSLLRGRDDTNSPGVELSPTYNRMFWNYTRGITAGEVIYALNYNIRERTEAGADGTINAEDAARQYPQGHGDAYGHYLTATGNYYRLLTDPEFTWAPRVEAVNVLGVPVQVDYFDERKFATAAARVAKTALQTTGLVHRQAHTDDRSAGWGHFRDGTNPLENFRDGEETSPKRTRHWGLDEWATRGTQGAYFNWIVGNAFLPAEDTVNTGIQKIDRTTVPELAEISSVATAIQAAADNANAFLNPLGLGSESQLFDISPTALANGQSHFEQVFERTKAALNNAFDTFDQATASTRLLRSLENQADDLSSAVYDQEGAYTGQLREIYGTPYAGDIGVGKAYPQGYGGPDLYRYFYIDNVSLITDPFEQQATTVTLEVPNYVARTYTPTNPDEVADVNTVASSPVSFTVNPESDVQYATPDMGRRQTVGQIQIAIQEIAALRENLAAAKDDYIRAKEVFDIDLRIFNEAIDTYEEGQRISKEVRDEIKEIEIAIAGLQAGIRAIDTGFEAYEAFSSAGQAGVPALVGIILGFSNGTFIDPRPIPSAIAKFGGSDRGPPSPGLPSSPSIPRPMRWP